MGTSVTVNRRASTNRPSIEMNSRLETKSSRVLLSPTVEPVKYLEIKSGMKSDNYSIVRASQVPSHVQLKDVSFPSSLSALQYALKPVITSSSQTQQALPQYQPGSRPASPYSRRSSPPRSATPVFSKGVIDSLKKSNDILTQEIAKLQSQVKNLKQKGEIQDTEIQKLKKSADEATILAAERSFRCIRAMQATKTITDQMNEITNKLPPDISESESFKNLHTQIESLLEIIRMQASEDNSTIPAYQNRSDKTLNSLSNYKEDHVNTGVQDMSQNIDRCLAEANGSAVSYAKATNQSSSENGSGTLEATKMEGQKEVIEQFEPGVYVTCVQLANGTKIFKRVRFSKRRFAEQQAEVWWKENKDRLLKKYTGTKQTKPSGEVDQDNLAAEETN